MADRDYYIYTYSEPGAESPFYVGKGFANRAWRHLFRSVWIKTPFYHKLQKMIANGIQPTIKLIETGLTCQGARELERLYIEKWGRADQGIGCLLNLTDGGEGVSGYRFTQEIRDHLSRVQKGNQNNKDYTESMKIPILARAGNGIVVERFSYINEAKKSGYDIAHILRCLKNPNWTHYDLFWEYDSIDKKIAS